VNQPLPNNQQDEKLLPLLKQLFWAAIDEDYRDAGQISQISAATELASLPLDSLATIELMYGIEEACGVYISEDEASELQTVGDIIRHIEARQQENATTARRPPA
jgi:acyl carrier protein